MDERRLFGQIAIDRGFIDQAQLLAALDHQVKLRRAGKGHKLLGVILVELGSMSPEQVFEVLQVFESEENDRAAPGAGVVQVEVGSQHGGPDTVPIDEPEPGARPPAGPLPILSPDALLCGRGGDTAALGSDPFEATDRVGPPPA